MPKGKCSKVILSIEIRENTFKQNFQTFSKVENHQVFMHLVRLFI